MVALKTSDAYPQPQPHNKVVLTWCEMDSEELESGRLLQPQGIQ